MDEVFRHDEVVRQIRRRVTRHFFEVAIERAYTVKSATERNVCYRHVAALQLFDGIVDFDVVEIFAETHAGKTSEIT